MSERCPRCDRPECDAKAATAAYYARVPIAPRDIDAVIAVQMRHAEACEECERNRVDWRARCLEAERIARLAIDALHNRSYGRSALGERLQAELEKLR